MKILVHDSQSAFSKLLQKSALVAEAFEVCETFEAINLKAEDYVAVIFFAYTPEELLDLLEVYKQNIPIILCSSDKDVYEKAKNIYGLIAVDMSTHKNEIVNYFNSLLVMAA
ncbi:hypothetical protein [Joostella sp. CR20]|uniref:hypothetical protein n=1 Tax=Joostella sp. CR20 TaxID=2804312 RepID=UPI00313BDCBD